MGDGKPAPAVVQPRLPLPREDVRDLLAITRALYRAALGCCREGSTPFRNSRC